MQTHGIFLDLDGTLADSMPALLQVYHQLLDSQGKKGSLKEFWQLAGLPLTDIMPELRRRHQLEASPHELLEGYYRLAQDLYQNHVQPNPGARRLLAAAREQGCFTAVVTSSPSRVAQAFLAQHGLSGLVELVVGGEQVSQGKPHPEPYLTALARSGLRPEQGLAVEDSTAGAASALAAGLATYLLVDPQAPPVQAPGTRGTITNLAELIPLLAGGGGPISACPCP